MVDGSQSTDKQAWHIASDPSAAEAKWMAAVTVLDQQKIERKTPVWIAMPWAWAVSTASTMGAVLTFALLQGTLCVAANGLIGGDLAVSFLAVAFALWFVPSIVFSMLFTYKRLQYGGGKGWATAKWLAVVAYLAFVSFWAVDGQPIRPWDLGLLLIWNSLSLGLAFLSTKWAMKTFASLNQTIGAKRVLRPMSICFAVLPFLMAPVMLSGLGSVMLFSMNSLMVFGTMTLASYMVSRRLGATSTSTAASVSAIVWMPFILPCLALFPVMVGTDTWLALTGGPYFVSWIDYIGAVGSLGVATVGPIVGGVIASKQLQRERAIGFEKSAPAGALADSGLSADLLIPTSVHPDAEGTTITTASD